jgi:hypothetical protein
MNFLVKKNPSYFRDRPCMGFSSRSEHQFSPNKKKIPRLWRPQVEPTPTMSFVGIQRHFMVSEIPGFDLPNRLSGLTTSLFSRDGIVKLIFNKGK